MANQQASDVEQAPTLVELAPTPAELLSQEVVRVIGGDYDLPIPYKCSLIYSGINWVYLVSALEQKSILRLSRTNRPEATFDDSAYRFELDLLNFLHEQGIPVAYPLVRRDKGLLGTMNTAEGYHYYSLFSFAHGEASESLEQSQVFSLGETLARLHLAADSFSSPHARFHLDEGFLIDTPLRRLRELTSIAKEDMAYLEELCTNVRARIASLPCRRSEYGVIHGDIWWTNVHFAGEKLTLFDFDYCGYGWRTYDIGALQGTAVAFGNPLSNAVVESFIAGYQSIRKLSEAELLAVPAFEKARIIWLLGLWASYSRAFIHVMGEQSFYEQFNATLANLKQWTQKEAE